MIYLIAGLVIFFALHLFSTFRSRDPGRDLRKKMGEGPYMGLYSLAAIAGFVLIVWGYGESRPAMIVWMPPVWTMHLNMLFQLLALPILMAAYMPVGYIARTLKHPMLVAVKLWALGHLLANGELNSILLFGSFLAYAVIDRIALKKRGDNGPPADVKPNVMGDVLSVAVGLSVYVAIAFWLHPILFGVSAVPMG